MRHGILLIDKPEGPTSHDIVQKVRSELNERSIGHLGTLDPAASGLLVLFVGKKALKVIELFQELTKTYEARIAFGKVSSTYDREGVIEEYPEKKGWNPPTERELGRLLLEKFSGGLSQIPPAHSAVHVNGKRAYELAREDPEVHLDLSERQVTISRIQLVSYSYPSACISMEVSSGTYVRSLAHDLGQTMRCGAYLEGLKREKVGSWCLEEAVNPEDVAWTDVIPLKDLLSTFPRCDLSKEQWEDVQHGRLISCSIIEEPTIAWFEDLPVAILNRKKGEAHPRKVL